MRCRLERLNKWSGSDEPIDPFKVDPELGRRLTAEVEKMQERAADASVGTTFTAEELDDPEHVSFERAFPLKRGKWQILPPGVMINSR
jgi:hypothetical protein